MVSEMNGWFMTDNDCMQFCKPMGDRVYRFIQAIWLDTTKEDKQAVNAKDESDNYVVVAATIDLKDVSKHDMECAISVYGYKLSDLITSYEDNCDELIAECKFENILGYDYYSKILSWDDAEKDILNYLQTH